jgi:two-component system nitrogen regulation response regulator NtrX
MAPDDLVLDRDLAFLDADSVESDGTAEAEVAMASLHEARDQFERDYILRALSAQRGNISRTADVLHVERSNLYRKMRAFGIIPTRRVGDEEESA